MHSILVAIPCRRVVVLNIVMLEKKLTEIVAKSIWSGNTHLRVSRETLHLPTREGGLNLLDIWAQNEAIDLMTALLTTCCQDSTTLTGVLWLQRKQ